MRSRTSSSRRRWPWPRGAAATTRRADPGGTVRWSHCRWWCRWTSGATSWSSWPATARDVTTIVSGSTADPHDYEPTPADTVEFEGADLVVVNGLTTTSGPSKAVDNAGGAPVVVDAGRTVGLRDGDNPHVWYGPEYVREVAAAVTTGLGDLAPEAREYFDRQQAEWQATMEPYDDRIASVSAAASGQGLRRHRAGVRLHGRRGRPRRPDADGLPERGPRTNPTPLPADIAAFEQLLEGGEVDVLIVNSQTEGPTPKRLRSIAEQADVPVVEVTETVPPGSDGFVDWQVEPARCPGRGARGMTRRCDLGRRRRSRRRQHRARWTLGVDRRNVPCASGFGGRRHRAQRFRARPRSSR